MEKVNKAADKVMDSLRQGTREQLTTSLEICPVHKTEMNSYMGKAVCNECQDVASAASMAHFKLALPPRLERCSFTNYHAENKKAKVIHEACVKYAEGWDVNSGGVIMLGSVGTGKTHLAAAICKKVCDKGNLAHITTIPLIIRNIRSSWNNKSTDEWGQNKSESDIIFDYSREYALLVIDEIGTQYGSDSEKITISEIINNRYNNLLPTIIIGNVTFSEAEEYLGKRVIDRIKDDGRVMIFDWESHRKLKG